MTQQISEFRTPIAVASEGQLRNAKKLQSLKNSEGQEVVRRSDIGNQANTESFIVETSSAYLVEKNENQEFTCYQLDQDNSRNKLCKGYQNCRHPTGKKYEKICKHIVAVDMKFGKHEEI